MHGRAGGAHLVAAGAVMLLILAGTSSASAAAPREPQPEPRSETGTTPGPSSVKTVLETVLEPFHLLGLWAVRCDAPRSTENWYGTYTIMPDGAGQLVFSAGHGLENVYTIRAAQPLSDTRLQLIESFAGEMFTVVLRFEGDQYRTEAVIRPDGSYQVKDGRFTGPGGAVDAQSPPSPLMHRCGSAERRR